MAIVGGIEPPGSCFDDSETESELSEPTGRRDVLVDDGGEDGDKESGGDGSKESARRSFDEVDPLSDEEAQVVVADVNQPVGDEASPDSSKVIVRNGVAVCEVSTAGFILWRAEEMTDGNSDTMGVGGYRDTSCSDASVERGTSGDETDPEDSEYCKPSEEDPDPEVRGSDVVVAGGNRPVVGADCLAVPSSLLLMVSWSVR
jgi:hypothetical protein